MSDPRDDEADEFTQNDDPEPFDQDPEDESDDATATIECPYCHEEIYEGSEFCHRCGKYISQEDTARKQPFWYSFGVVLCILLIILTAIGFVTMVFLR